MKNIILAPMLCLSSLTFLTNSYAEDEPLYGYYISSIPNYATDENDDNDSGLYRTKQGCRIVTDSMAVLYRTTQFWDFDQNSLKTSKVTNHFYATYDYTDEDFQELKKQKISLEKSIQLDVKNPKILQQFKDLKARFNAADFQKCYPK